MNPQFQDMHAHMAPNGYGPPHAVNSMGQIPPPHAGQMQHHHPMHQYQVPDESAANGALPVPVLPSGQQHIRQSAPLQDISRTDTSTGRRYSLQVVQQPKRARMCGFGDKDRRPITPPPCVRLVIIDEKTGKEVDCNEIDHSMFVLNVDLWAEDGTSEVNLVKHSAGTPSISSTTPASYTEISTSTPAYSHVLPTGREANYGQSPMGYNQVMPGYNMQPGYNQSPYMPQNGYAPPNQFYGDFRPDVPPNVVPSQAAMTPYGRQVYPDMSTPRVSVGGGQPQGMFTRNLIGSLAASAFRLTDPDDKIGIWFILQDLSVRTEGSFRLRFSFVNVSAPPAEPTGEAVNKKKAPVLALAFSDVFTVFSAKKFPGVCESTQISKCFAGQGIKIPIRKEANSKGGDDDDDY